MAAMKVSVVIPAWNAQACLSRAIRSVLAQTLPPFEILVVDDGSTDATPSLVRQFGSPVRLIHQGHAGAAAARNTGIAAASGEYIAFLDADDEWLPRKLQRQMSLHRDHELVLSFSGSNEWDA